MDPSPEFEGPVEGPVEGLIEGPVEGPVKGPSSEPKGHGFSTYKCGYDRAGQTELVKQYMVKEELVNSHDLLGPVILPINREAIKKVILYSASPPLPPYYSSITIEAWSSLYLYNQWRYSWDLQQ
ncbi:hypothetical protein Tco_0374993 [Tanacetum coccineum]